MTAFRAPVIDPLEDLPLHPPQRIRPGVMAQRWDDLAFISWAYEVEPVRRLLPPDLEIDTFDGAAWVSAVPFRLGVRLPGTPTLPWASRFPEVNVRTYVRGPDGRRGIWFLSLDAARLGAVVVARGAYRLPYLWARTRITVEGNRCRYTGARRWPGGDAAWDLTVDVGGAMEDATDLHRFLTARWRLYSPGPLTLPARAIGFRSTTVEHPRWPLRHARLAEGEESLLAAAGLPRPFERPIVAFSPGVSVRFGPSLPVLPAQAEQLVASAATSRRSSVPVPAAVTSPPGATPTPR